MLRILQQGYDMKSVFGSNGALAEVWVNRKNKGYGKGNNMRFDTTTIYSFGSHFPIAKFNEGEILYTMKGYSSSTGKHKHIVKREMEKQKQHYMKVPNVLALTASEHMDNLKKLQEEINATYNKSKRAHKRRPIYAETLKEMIKNHNDYIDAFLTSEPHFSDVDLECDLVVLLLKK